MSLFGLSRQDSPGTVLHVPGPVHEDGGALLSSSDVSGAPSRCVPGHSAAAAVWCCCLWSSFWAGVLCCCGCGSVVLQFPARRRQWKRALLMSFLWLLHLAQKHRLDLILCHVAGSTEGHALKEDRRMKLSDVGAPPSRLLS